jgi:hypothetical protein
MGGSTDLTYFGVGISTMRNAPLGHFIKTKHLGLAIFLAALNFNSSFASLGQKSSSIDFDRATSHGVKESVSVPVSSNKGYTVEQFRSGCTEIREYISSSQSGQAGHTVFGIAWKGCRYPSMALLLGSYTGEVKKALAASPKQHGQRYLHLETDKLVIKRGGRVRHLEGHAYDPSLLPSGVSAEVIR